jgi:HlyD family secretion protein
MNATSAEVTPEVEVVPRPPAIEPDPGKRGPGRRSSRRWIAIALGVIAVSIIAVVVVITRSNSPTAANHPLSSSTISGQVLRLRGTTEAVQARAVLAPLLEGAQVGSLTIIHMAPAGSRVKQGDLLVEFDRQAQQRDFFDKQAEYQKLVDQVAEEQAKENATKAKDQTELKTSEDNLRKSELEIQKAEIVSRIDAEKNQESLDEAKATYDQLRETFDLKRAAALAAIRILEIQRDRTQQTMLHAQANSNLMQIHAPIDGIVVLNSIWKEGTMGEVQEGDQVRPGVPFMQVVNPAAMEVRVLANQQDFPSLHIGQAAKVRLDAYPDLVFSAKVEQLAPIGENGSFSSKLRQFAVITSIDGNDPKLMPDLSAAVDVDVSGNGNDKIAGVTGGSAAGGTR